MSFAFRCVVASLILATTAAFAQQPLTADAIMARVAANQEKAIELRSHYVYKQHTHTTSHKTTGKLMREETDDYDVFPSPKGVERKLQTLSGRYWHKGKYEEFHAEPIPDADSIDADLTHDFIHDSDQQSTRDGVGSDLFPLTAEKQKDYQFHLLGEETMNGRAVYHIEFSPKDKNDIDWKGEAFIDKEEFQPVNVFTRLNKKLPFFVRGVLGVDVPGVGFNVQYVRVEKDVWFPESFGTEFELALFHLWSRNIAVSLKNSDFVKTHVDTKINVPDMAAAPVGVPVEPPNVPKTP
jgi:outer membrane lipoprotein-sorting protein